MNTSDFVSIEKKIEDLKLHIKVKENYNTGKEFYWNIKIKDEEGWVFESKYTKEKEFTVPIRCTGKYIIFVQAKRNNEQLDHFRDSIWYRSDKEKESFRVFLNGFSDKGGGDAATCQVAISVSEHCSSF